VVTEIDLRRLGRILATELAHIAGPREHLDDLCAELQRAKIVAPAEVPPDVVTMNSTVRLRDLDTSELETYTLVYPYDANIAQHRLSIFAPIGTAILGYRVGDIVQWRVPAGMRRLRIEEVTYQPERAGDSHL
jgi:regulator of nucleoside diphosphate kinase